jgi:hypothetical protein
LPNLCVIGEIQRNIRVRYVPKGILISLLSCAGYVTGILMEQTSLECTVVSSMWAIYQEKWHGQEKWEPLGSSCCCDTHGQPVFWPIDVFNVILSLV